MKFQLVVLICLLQFISSVVGIVIPKWSKNYHVKGTLNVPEAGVVQPFEVWYDERSKRSRIDYYYGMVKSYQSLEDSQFGVETKIFPYTNHTHLNVQVCLKEEGTAANPISLQPALYPIEDMFNFEGHTYYNGKKVQKWVRYELTDFGMSNRHMKFLFLVKCREKLIDVICRPKCTPIRLEMEGKDLILNNHVGNYYIDYHVYEPNTVRLNTVYNSFPRCRDTDNLLTKRKKTPDSLATFLPSLSKIVHENRGFDDFTEKYGSEFSSMKQFRSLFRDFKQKRRKNNAKYKVKLKEFFDVKNFIKNNYRLPAIYKRTGKNRRKLTNHPIQLFQYTEEDRELVARHPSYDLRPTMNPVQSQLNCGSCWAFSTIAALEGSYFKKYKMQVKLSEQVLIDCSWGYSNLGCDGGVEVYALDWIMDHGGMPFHIDYGPYKAKNGFCMKQNSSETVQVRRYMAIESGDYLGIQIALIKYGPVMTSMHASLTSFTEYDGGVYNDPNCRTDVNSSDHAVLIVGYGRMLNQLYWIVQNSWSKLWGKNGYFMIMAQNNVCGLLNEPLFVQVV